MGTIRKSTEKERQRFANFMRTKPEHVLRRISTAFDIATQYRELGLEGFQNAMKRQFLEGYVINGRELSISQARIVYEMVTQGKYGGLKRNDRPYNPQLAITQRPEGYFPPIIPQDMEECRKEMDRLLENEM
jgi:hypothetical protein